MLLTDERNCGRIIWDDRELVAKVWKRIDHIPEVQEIVRLEDAPKIFGNGPQKRGEVWEVLAAERADAVSEVCGRGVLPSALRWEL